MKNTKTIFEIKVEEVYSSLEGLSVKLAYKILERVSKTLLINSKVI